MKLWAGMKINYFLFSHLLHKPFFLLGFTPNKGLAIILYKKPSNGTLHFAHLFNIPYFLEFKLYNPDIKANKPKPNEV